MSVRVVEAPIRGTGIRGTGIRGTGIRDSANRKRC
jgi:hypothetical protein